MANLLLVIDADIERRDRFTAKVETLIAPFDGLRTERCVAGELCAIWARSPRAPVDWSAAGGHASIVWGDAIRQDETTRVDARMLAELWRDPVSAEVFDGFHLAAIYEHGRLLAGADRLGLFPLYYWSVDDVVLVGSSPALFRHHPSFRTHLNAAGLAGILLTGHLVNGQTLLDGVRRVAAGALLVCAKGGRPREVPRYRLLVSRTCFDQPFSTHLDLLDEVLARAISRHAPADRRYTLLLSGGLDSRMIAGYLAETGAAIEALTLGRESDLELNAATRVARALRLAHRAADIPFELYPLYAHLQCTWEHLSNGFSTIRLWGLPPLLASHPPWVVAGYVTDALVGGPLVHYLPGREAPELSFETVFAFYNRAGLRPTALATLLRREVFGDAIENTIASLRAAYESYSDLDAQRAWCFELYHRQRFHVGSTAWRLCFGAWPVLPTIDREVLDVVGAMPPATVARRRAQKALVIRRFPALAALPLDRNSYDTSALIASWRWRLTDYLRQRVARMAAPRRTGWQHERRYYYRMYDIDNPGWRAVRAAAEPLRPRVLHLFDPHALDRLLPAPGTPVHCRDPIVDTSGMKLLLGLLLWSRDHL